MHLTASQWPLGSTLEATNVPGIVACLIRVAIIFCDNGGACITAASNVWRVRRQRIAPASPSGQRRGGATNSIRVEARVRKVICTVTSKPFDRSIRCYCCTSCISQQATGNENLISYFWSDIISSVFVIIFDHAVTYISLQFVYLFSRCQLSNLKSPTTNKAGRVNAGISPFAKA